MHKKSTFLEKLKLAIVKLLFKSGNKEAVSHYWPISMLCNFLKIVEKMIKHRLIFYLESNAFLSKNQFGIKPGKSTIKALYLTTKFIYKKINNNDKAIVTFLCIANAFNAVDHNELLKILPSYGIMNEYVQ